MGGASRSFDKVHFFQKQIRIRFDNKFLHLNFV